MSLYFFSYYLPILLRRSELDLSYDAISVEAAAVLSPSLYISICMYVCLVFCPFPSLCIWKLELFNTKQQEGIYYVPTYVLIAAKAR